MSHEIDLQRGFGPLRFGMTVAEVRKVFPVANVYEDWMGGNLNDCLLYPGLILGFNQCGTSEPPAHARLDRIAIQGRSDAMLFGRPFNAWNRAELLSHFEETGKSPEGDRDDAIWFEGQLFTFTPDNQLQRVDYGPPEDLEIHFDPKAGRLELACGPKSFAPYQAIMEKQLASYPGIPLDRVIEIAVTDVNALANRRESNDMPLAKGLLLTAVIAVVGTCTVVGAIHLIFQLTH